MLNNKGELAILCDDEFPSDTIKIIPGLPVIKTDTIFSKTQIEIPCPEPTPENPKPSVKCPPEKIITITEKQTDTAVVPNLKKERALEYKLENAQSDLQKQKRKTEHYKKALIFSVIAFIVLLFIRR